MCRRIFCRTVVLLWLVCPPTLLGDGLPRAGTVRVGMEAQEFQPVSTTGSLNFNSLNNEITAKSGQSFVCYQISRDLYVLGSLNNDDRVYMIIGKSVNPLGEQVLAVSPDIDGELSTSITLLSKRPVLSLCNPQERFVR